MARRAIAVFLALVAGLFLFSPARTALAQRQVIFGPPPSLVAPSPRRGFLDLMFGNRPVGPPTRGPRTVRPPSRATTPPAVVAKIPVAKDPAARKILVVGDFVAAVAAAGLDQTFAEEPKVRIIDRTNANSGIVRSDVYDWLHELPTILAGERPDMVVVALGANDRQTLPGAGAAAFGTPEWEGVYTTRVEGLAKALEAYGAPFFWIGAPPMKLAAAERDMAYLNGLFGPRVTTAAGAFVDVWDGFADAEGRFVTNGPDADGQIVPLRTSNGIGFTDAGRRKLAFYVEGEIRRRTGIGTGTVDLLVSLSQASRIEVGRDGRRRLVGPVISLADPPPGGSTVLAGEGGAFGGAPLLAAPKDGQSPQSMFVIHGIAPTPVAGRADDFSWPRRAGPSGAVAAAQAQAATPVLPRAAGTAGLISPR